MRPSTARPVASVAPLVLALLALLPGPPAQAQGNPGAGPGAGVNREAMWPAPTAEDWARPCLITWQRTYEDAQAVSRATGKPILVCVNMDGEIASEHYAGIRYRQPEIAALYAPYVCVIASVYRHTPRDFDEHGRRIACPRFGTVTCGEHIAIEPGLYEQYFEGRRIAPRHIGVELDGQETYDVFYAWDTDSVFAAIKDGVANRPPPLTPPEVRGEGSILERVASRDVVDREAVERAYVKGDRALQHALLQRAVELGADAPVDLLRLALAGFDADLAAMARAALAQAESEKAVDLIVESLGEALPAADREALVAALERLGESSPRARLLAVVQRGLAGEVAAGGARALDAASWAAALDQAPPTEPATYRPALAEQQVVQQLETQSDVLRSADADAHLELAEAFLAEAYEHVTEDDDYVRYLLMDARDTALKAEALGASGWRVDATIGVASYYLGDVELAHARAEAAMEDGLPPDAQDWNSMAVLAVFAQARQEAITAAVKAKQEWPAEWLADVHDVCTLLARHPHGTAEQIVAHYDFLNWLGGRGDASRVLEQGLLRFPGSWELHERLRRSVLGRRGIEGLEPAYEERLLAPDLDPAWLWFAGRASFITAEFRRRAGEDRDAVAAYERAIAHLRAYADADTDAESTRRTPAADQIALAHAGLARLAYERGDDALALDELLASFGTAPLAAANLDGLNISAVDTAKMLRARLVDAEQAELLARLEAALGELDPALLQLPAYERELPARPAGGRRRG